MLSATYSHASRKEEGFTLIELLVVVIVIGILAAIALPIFIDQQKVAVDASVKSDVRNTVTNITNAQAQQLGEAKAAVSNDSTSIALTAVPLGSAANAQPTVSIATKAAPKLDNVPALGSAWSLQGWNSNGKKLLGSAANPGWELDSTTGSFGQANAAHPDDAVAADPGDGTPLGGSTPVVFSTLTLSDAKVGESYSTTIAASGSPTSFTATGLPSGLSIDDSGKISGTPNDDAKSYSVKVTAKSATSSADKTYTLELAAATPVSISTASLDNGAADTQYSATIAASGNPTAFAAAGLPSGLSIDDSGKISGKISATAAGDYSVKVTARTPYASDEKTYTLKISGSIAYYDWADSTSDLQGWTGVNDSNLKVNPGGQYKNTLAVNSGYNQANGAVVMPKLIVGAKYHVQVMISPQDSNQTSFIVNSGSKVTSTSAPFGVWTFIDQDFTATSATQQLIVASTTGGSAAGFSINYVNINYVP